MAIMRRDVQARTLEADFSGLRITLLTGTTGPTEGFNFDFAHGFPDVDKILGWTARVKFDDNTWVAQGQRTDPINQEFMALQLSATQFRLAIRSGNSAGIRSKPFEILVFHLD